MARPTTTTARAVVSSSVSSFFLQVRTTNDKIAAYRDWLQQLRALCTKLDIPLLFDEVVVLSRRRVLPCVMCRHVLSCQIDDGHQAPRHTPRCSSTRWCRHVPRQFTRSCAMPRHQRGVHQTPSSPSPLLFDDEARHVCVCVINGAAVSPPPPRLPPLNIATRAS